MKHSQASFDIRNAVLAPMALFGCLCTGAASANLVEYQDYMEWQSIRIGTVDHVCAQRGDATCAFITITATGDTSTVTSFSVPGASGFKNVLSSAKLSVYFWDGSTYGADINLGIGGMYVSVDQTNNGAGFGSTAGPTYPLATFGNGFANYDLTTDIFQPGFGPFCPNLALCANGSPMFTTDGTEFVITRGLGPAYSRFSSTVTQTVPEPATAGLVLFSIVALFGSRRRRA
jgi:hypothetical protein